MPTPTDEFPAVFAALRAILEPYANRLVLKHDTDTDYYLNTAHICKNKQPLFFGAVTIKKNYVSFYLMPGYVFPELREAESDALKARSQGKACYNFTRVDPALFAELERLTQLGFERYESAGMLGGKWCA